MSKKQRSQDKQTSHTGKVENDFNKSGDQKATAKNERQRTPVSRNDRQSNLGGSNQSSSRQGGVGGKQH